MLNDTIVAVSTSMIAASAINIIRLSGPETFNVLKKIFRTRAADWEGYRIYHGNIVDPADGTVVDDVLVSIFRTPHSYTGEDMAEINCHGGLYVTRRVYGLCLENGARPAINGEYTRRAFLNGKMDLTQAEAVNDLIMADSRNNAKLAVNNLKGSVARLLSPLMDDVMQIIANIEVNIDYPEYDDVGVITAGEIKPLIADWLERCDKILEAAASSMIIRQGVKTVIVGKPNVGKSSLLNAMLAEDKAIVTEIAGTTRDLVEGDIHLKNVTLHLIDTAGIHDTENMIERIGIEKSQKALDEAELVILVFDASQDMDEEDRKLLEATEGKNRIIVYNKTDKVQKTEGIGISAVNGDIEGLITEINRRFENNEVVLNQPSLNNERQISLMKQARESMILVRNALNEGIPLDLINEDLQNSFRCLKEILGQYSREDLLDGIFSRFCVGK